jgi:REP element-mobilizing transposase RayT
MQSFKFCKEMKGLKVYAFVIMDNHFHLIASAPELSNTLASLKKFTAKEIIALLEQDNKEWLLSQLAF